MTEQPHMVPSIAIIDANVLEATGLKSILCDIVPKVTVSTFKSLLELQQAMQDGETFAHYFASPQVVLKHSTFFLEHARQTIVLTAQPPTGKLLERFRCLSSSMTEHDLIKAVLSLHQMGHGGHPHAPFHHGNIPEQEIIGPTIEISPREQEVLALVARGFLNKEIADRLCISLTTVISHRKNICEKLHLRSVSSLTIYAVTHGIIQIEDI
ncbi:MAG: response regulator transcription factor [Bacteroidaceae bacterium]|nr:response regulator transcription factor [Bacteroidaceae bacterium]